MSRVKVVQNREVVYKKVGYTQASGPFDMDPDTAAPLLSSGLLELVEGEEPAAGSAVDVSFLPELPENLEAALRGAGFPTVQAVAAAAVEDLTPIKGIGKVTAEKMIEDAKALIG